MADRPAPEPPAPDDGGGGERPVRVLLVEDDEDDYLLTRDLLAEVPGSPYELEWVSTAEAGREAVREDRHDVYLLDYRLGRDNGLELLAEAVARGCKGPVILLTGEGEREVDVEAMRAGAADFLEKGSIDAAMLERSIRYAIERKRDQDALRQMHAALEDRVRERTAELEAVNEELRTEVRNRRRAEEKLRFLADASRSLAVLVDHESTLGEVARLAVPFLADWCVVYMAGEGGAVRRVAEDADPSKGESLRRLWELYPAAADPPAPVAGVFRTGRPELSAGTDGTSAAASCMALPLFVRGETVGVLAFFHADPGRRYGADDLRLAEDLARRVAVAVDNAQLYKEVKDADRRKDEFLAMLAHELRNPLAPVRNALHILRLAAKDPAALEQTRPMMERQVEHLVRLVDDLLDVSRLMRGKIALRPERVDLAAVIARAAETAGPVIDARGHRLEITLPPEPLPVSGDVVRLTQVLANLLTNAAKYQERAGRIRLTAGREGGSAVVRVKDDGIGIAPDLLPHIFDLFMQADHSLARSQGGLGIGLTLVHSLVQMHGGSVEARSAGPGQGSEFTVRLPLLTEAEPAAAAEAPRPEKTAAGRKQRVLIVDDNVDGAHSLAMLVRLWGHEVRLAHDGPGGVELAETYRPDLVLLDIGLPGLSGYEVARQIRDDPGLAGSVLVAMTGYGQEEDRRRSRAAGFDHHLVKPVEPGALEELLARER